VKLSGWDICNESRLMVVPKMLRQAARIRAGQVEGALGVAGAAVALAGAILLIPFGVSARGVNGERDFGWRDLQDKTARSEFFSCRSVREAKISS
jgi:hypothetical protein